jgi:hypothetical protein
MPLPSSAEQQAVKAEFYTPLPAGTYKVFLSNVDENVQNRAGTGTYDLATFKVLEGPHKGKTVKNYFNFGSANETARRIASEDLDRMKQSMGAKAGTSAESWAQLTGKPFVIRVKLNEREYPEVASFIAPEYQEEALKQQPAESSPVVISAPEPEDDSPF